MRIFVFGLLAFSAVLQVASGATISAVFKGGFDNGGTLVPGKIIRETLNGPQTSYFGSVKTWVPPNYDLLVQSTQDLDSNSARIRTDVSQSGSPSSTTTFALTTYSQLYTPGGQALADSVQVFNSGYWEFTINGIYNWVIDDQKPEGRSPLNTRTFQFVKVVGNVETLVGSGQNLSGIGRVNPSGTNLGSGTYRLKFTQFDPGPKDIADPGAGENSTNLDIQFSFVSEDGGGGVIPEPSSIAVFGLLSLGTAISKWRRKK